ncbi:substrate-binding periplasmic protein [Aestuariirhabdus sp. LZHN29]|uniref:substrate-binding periplasmic protein n=1 Tax=Aestuariirhabdus sp. LZHN29 TaxID=3417462 RepID=UPI003CED346F
MDWLDPVKRYKGGNTLVFLIRQRLFGALLAFAMMPAVQADTMRLAADIWYPYNGEPSSDYPGYMVELATEILQDADHELDYLLMPWSRSLLEARKGNIDCVVGAFRGDAPDFLYPKVSMGRDDVAFFALAENRGWQFSSVASLNGVRVAVISGYSYGDELNAYIKRNRRSPNLQITTGNAPLERNISLLQAKRVELLVASPNVMNATLKRSGQEGKVVEVGRMHTPDDLYIACSPNLKSSEYYVRLLGEGVERLRADGRLHKILERYGLVDWQQ